MLLLLISSLVTIALIILVVFAFLYWEIEIIMLLVILALVSFLLTIAVSFSKDIINNIMKSIKTTKMSKQPSQPSPSVITPPSQPERRTAMGNFGSPISKRKEKWEYPLSDTYEDLIDFALEKWNADTFITLAKGFERVHWEEVYLSKTQEELIEELFSEIDSDKRLIILKTLDGILDFRKEYPENIMKLIPDITDWELGIEVLYQIEIVYYNDGEFLVQFFPEILKLLAENKIAKESFCAAAPFILDTLQHYSKYMENEENFEERSNGTLLCKMLELLQYQKAVPFLWKLTGLQYDDSYDQYYREDRDFLIGIRMTAYEALWILCEEEFIDNIFGDFSWDKSCDIKTKILELLSTRKTTKIEAILKRAFYDVKPFSYPECEYGYMRDKAGKALETIGIVFPNWYKEGKNENDIIDEIIFSGEDYDDEYFQEYIKDKDFEERKSFLLKVLEEMMRYNYYEYTLRLFDLFDENSERDELRALVMNFISDKEQFKEQFEFISKYRKEYFS